MNHTGLPLQRGQRIAVEIHRNVVNDRLTLVPARKMLWFPEKSLTSAMATTTTVVTDDVKNT